MKKTFKNSLKNDSKPTIIYLDTSLSYLDNQIDRLDKSYYTLSEKSSIKSDELVKVIPMDSKIKTENDSSAVFNPSKLNQKISTRVTSGIASGALNTLR